MGILAKHITIDKIKKVTSLKKVINRIIKFLNRKLKT